ncbi:MAG: hydrogenase maturation protease [Elusimicrobiota bacterium]
MDFGLAIAECGMKNNKTLILGLGNPILSDDAAGIIVGRKVYEFLLNSRSVFAVEFREASYAGWRLIDFLGGYSRAVIIDAVLDDSMAVGEVCEINRSAICSIHLQSSHGMGLAEALELAGQSGMLMPRQIYIYGIGINKADKFGESLSPEIEQKLPSIVQEIAEAVKDRYRESDICYK